MEHSITIKPKNSGRKQLFDNPVLERLTRTNSAVPISIFVIFALALLAYAFMMANLPHLTIGLLFLTGLLAFTLAEYLTHRYLFHMGTHTATRSKIQYTIHGVHHEFPKDEERLAMPPVLSVTILFVLLGTTYLLMNNHAFAFLPGFVLGYAGYLFIHYLTHAYPPPKNLFRWLWVNHSIHHYRNGEKAFGVTSPFWDYVFGTMP